MNASCNDNDDPALEITSSFSATIPPKYREVCNKENRTPKLGPPSVKPNPIRCSLYSPRTRGLIMGMEGGEVLHWTLSSDTARKISLIGQHKGSVTAVHLPPDKETICDKLVVSGSADGTVKIWSECSGARIGCWECVQTLYGHGGSVLAIECVRDYIITGGTDRRVRLWWAVDERKMLQHPWFESEGVIVTMEGWVQDMSFPRGQRLGQGATLFVADSSAGVVKVTPKGHIDPNTRRLKSRLDWTVARNPTQPNGSSLAFRKIHDRGISIIKFVPDMDLVFTASYDNCLRVYDNKTSTLKLSWENENNCRFTAILYDRKRGQVITTDMLGYLAIYCLKKETMLATKRLTTKPILSIHHREATDDYVVILEGEIQVWRIERDVGYNVLRGGHTGPVVSLYTCSGGKGLLDREQDFRIFSASLDKTLRLWDPHDLGCLRCLTERQSEISCMTFSEKENTLIVGHDDGVIRLWNMDTDTCVQLAQHTNSITALRMAPVGRQEELLLSAGYDGMVCIWDVRKTRGAKPHLVGRIRAHNPEATTSDPLAPACRPEILCLEFDKTRRVIFTGGNDCHIKAWSLTTHHYLGRHVGHKEPISCMAMDANFLFSGSEDRTINVWDALPAPPLGSSYSSHPFRGGTLLKTLQGHKGTVTGLVILKASGHLVSCSVDGFVMVWDYVSGDMIRRHHHDEEVLCIALRYDVDEIMVGTRQSNILRLPAGEKVATVARTESGPQ
ncbi:hypothetical protein BSKO_04974 [Bryopsis sp. KO-2023]|nr:hypothetical protein BSKO_04974 [Bryopsis sp. KO-2023]